MSHGYQVIYRTVALSGTVSSAFELIKADMVGIWSPVVTSGQAYLHASYDTRSANFVRLNKADGTSSWVWSLGAGSKSVFPDVFRPFAYGKIVLQNPQTAVRSFAIVQKFG